MKIKLKTTDEKSKNKNEKETDRAIIYGSDLLRKLLGKNQEQKYCKYK